MADYSDEDIDEAALRELEDEGREESGGEEPPKESLPAQARGRGTLYRLKVGHSSETLLASAGELGELAQGTEVVMTTRYGRDIGTVLGTVRGPSCMREDVLRIDRLATKDDLSKAEANRQKEKEAFRVCQEKILTRNLAMKLVSAHYLLEEPKILFFFTAETRVDFRELVKDLVAIFKMRIELRQIGVRDEARVLGGVGVCGQVFCCHGVTDKLNAVSIKMAKDQNLSLNSLKISGPCGRLLCCLAYESQYYRDERRGLPQEGAKVLHEGILYRVTEVNVLKGLIRLSGEEGRILKLPSRRFRRGEDGKWMILPDEAPQQQERKDS